MSASDTHTTFDPATQELVILVHGTFANNSSKSGGNHRHWWQAGGDVWTKIDQQLPSQFHVASDAKTEVFSWSGDNSERDRRAGGRELFERLLKLEKAGANYHLVGHSHGGSVIWHCLLESVKRRYRRRRNDDEILSLPGLRSYTTIGTPFLQLKAFGLATRFGPWFWFVMMGVSVGLIGLFMLVNQEIVSADEWRDSIAGPGTDNSKLLDAIFQHPVAAVGLGVLTALTAFFAMVMWAWASAVQLEASIVREGTRIRNQAFVEFGARWLGIWSRHDEAINGLRASLKLVKQGGQIAPRIEVSGVTVFDFDRRMRFYRFFARWFIAPAFNRLISWPSDRIIWKSVSRAMQGNDRPGCKVSDVSPGPIVPKKIEWEQLPEAYDNRLVEQSNKCLIERSQTLLPQLREVFAQLAWTRPEQLSLLLNNQTSFEGNELVHTSYFHEPAILELISCHILRHNRVKAPRPDSKSATTRWCRRFRHKARDLSRDASLQTAALPLLGQRNRRAGLSVVFSILLLVFWVSGIGGVEQFAYSSQLPHDFVEALYYLLTAVAVLVVPPLARSGIKRAKLGARSPGIARWGWRFARVTFVIYSLILLSQWIPF